MQYVRVACSITIPPRKKTPLVVQTEAVGLSFIPAHRRNPIKSLKPLASGIMDLQPETPFRVTMSRARDYPKGMHKHTVVDILLPAPRILFTDVAPERKPTLKPETNKEYGNRQFEEKVRIGEK